MQPERPVQTTLAFHASRIVTDAGVLLAMAAMSLPFVTSGAGDRSSIDADALPALLLLLPIFVVTLIPDHTRPLHPALGWSALALGLAALPYALVKMLDAEILADTLNGSVGIGARLLVVACLVSVIGIGIGLLRSVRGLPSGGTPNRTATYQSEPRPRQGDAVVTEPAPEPRPQSDTKDTAKLPEPVPETRQPEPAEIEDEVPPTPSEPPPAPPAAPVQPEIVFPDTGAVAREARPQPVSPDDPSTTAERADAALDDHLDSMFDGEGSGREGAEDESGSTPG